MNRPNWHEYFAEITKVVATRTTCDRGIKKGCVIVKDNRILATGYAGSPPGMGHCNEIGHLMVKGHCLRTIHAERNALNFAAKYGVSVDGATAYVTDSPCYHCSKDLVAAGIKTIIILNNEYHSNEQWQVEERNKLFYKCNVKYYWYDKNMLKNLLPGFIP